MITGIDEPISHGHDVYMYQRSPNVSGVRDISVHGTEFHNIQHIGPASNTTFAL